MIARLVLAAPHAVDVLRRSLARDRVLYEARASAGGAEWCAGDAEAPFDLDAPRPLTGAKHFFFPSRETVLRWRGEDVEAVPPDTRPFALFGLHACDLTAIAYQDRFFADDPWYACRRKAAFLVGINCLTACAGGFCPEMDAGPFARTGYDLNLSRLPDRRIFLEVGTHAGLEALGRAGVAVEPPDTAALTAFENCRTRSLASFPARPFIGRAMARVERREVSDHEWQALGPSCLACTGCTSVCPTCSCYTMVDEVRDGTGERARVWDSCLLEGFQREASGHHPAPRPGDRVRRFWYHKLSSDFVDFGRPGCVGCGRCDVACPGSIGALRVLGALGSQ